MTAKELTDWLESMGISKTEAARRLGIHQNTMTKWCRDGAPEHVRLACIAIWHRLDVTRPW